MVHGKQLKGIMEEANIVRRHAIRLPGEYSKKNNPGYGFGAWGGVASMLALAITLVATLRVNAQVLYGSLTGTVTDASGAVLPNAQVTALEIQTGVSNTQGSDSA